MKNEKELNQAVRPAVRQTLYAPPPASGDIFPDSESATYFV